MIYVHIFEQELKAVFSKNDEIRGADEILRCKDSVIMFNYIKELESKKFNIYFK